MHHSAGFDLSPVMRSAGVEGTPDVGRDGTPDVGRTQLSQEIGRTQLSQDIGRTQLSQDTVSTTNPDYSQEKDMAYYLAKIKAKAAQKTLEMRLLFTFLLD